MRAPDVAFTPYRNEGTQIHSSPTPTSPNAALTAHVRNFAQSAFTSYTPLVGLSYRCRVSLVRPELLSLALSSELRMNLTALAITRYVCTASGAMQLSDIIRPLSPSRAHKFRKPRKQASATISVQHG